MDHQKELAKDTALNAKSKDQAHKLANPPNAFHGWRLHTAVLG